MCQENSLYTKLHERNLLRANASLGSCKMHAAPVLYMLWHIDWHNKSTLPFFGTKCVRFLVALAPAFTSAPEARRASKFCGCPTHAAFAQMALLPQAGNKTKTLALHLRSTDRFSTWHDGKWHRKKNLQRFGTCLAAFPRPHWETVRFLEQGF